jgi:hypothetical protein
MARLTCILLLVAAVGVPDAQSLGDAARKAEDQRNTLPPARQTFGAKDLPAPARIDAILGDFRLTQNLLWAYKRAQLGIVKARADAKLDAWLMRWEHETRDDPFAMEQQYRSERRLVRVFDASNISPRDYIFFEQALSRARIDQRESKAARATMNPARVANVQFIEKHEGNLGPSLQLEQELGILERRRRATPRS